MRFLAAIARRIQLADLALCRACVPFQIAPAFALIIFELAPRGPERITQRDVRILLRLVGGMRVMNPNLPIVKSVLAASNGSGWTGVACYHDAC